MTREGKKILLFFLVSIFLISVVPLLNSAVHFIFEGGSRDEFFSEVDAKWMFSTDSIEGVANLWMLKKNGSTINKRNVIAGLDDYLFLGDQHNSVVRQIEGRGLPKDSEINSWAARFLTLQEWFEAKGMRFVLVVAPNKHSVYREKLPPWVQYQEINTSSVAVKALQDQGVNVLDVLPLLREEKKHRDVYYKTDTHWDELGAAIAFDQTIDFVNQVYGDDLRTIDSAFELVSEPAGDLARLLKIDDYLDAGIERVHKRKVRPYDICLGRVLRKSFVVERCDDVESEEVYINFQPMYTFNSNASNDARVFLVGDSFTTKNSMLYGEAFSYVWRMHFNHIQEGNLVGFLDEVNPDLVVYQIIERSLYSNALVSLPK